MLDNIVGDLFARVDRLTGEHTKRNPRTAEIHSARKQVMRVRGRTYQAGRAMALTQLAIAEGDVTAAVPSLLAAARTCNGAERSRAIALSGYLARMIVTAPGRGIARKQDDVPGLYQHLEKIARLGSPDLAKRVRTYRLVAANQLIAALRLAILRTETDENAAHDIVLIVGRLLSRKRADAVVNRINGMLEKLDLHEKPELQSAIYRFVFDARVRAASRSAGAPPTAEEVTEFLEANGHAGARALAQSKETFTVAFDGCEAVKDRIVDGFRAFCRDTPTRAGAKHLLDIASWTQRFWRDAAFRDPLLEEIASMIAKERGGAADFLRGLVAFLQGRIADAEAQFAGAVEKSAELAKTGASSFFAGLSEEDEAPLLRPDTDFTNVNRTDHAFVCCADLKYFERYAANYLKSAREKGGRIRLHFHIAAPTHRQARQAFKRLLSGERNVSFSSEVPIFPIPTYYASMRFLRAPDFLTYVADRVVLTDIDVLFRANANNFLKSPLFAEADLGLRVYDKVRLLGCYGRPRDKFFRYPRLVPWGQVNAAAVLLLATPAGRHAAEQIARDMRRHLGRALKDRNSAWWIDQNSLLATLLTLRAEGGVRIVNLEDAGLPCGSFDYTGSEAMPGGHPLVGGF